MLSSAKRPSLAFLAFLAKISEIDESSSAKKANSFFSSFTLTFFLILKKMLKMNAISFLKKVFTIFSFSLKCCDFKKHTPGAAPSYTIYGAYPFFLLSFLLFSYCLDFFHKLKYEMK